MRRIVTTIIVICLLLSLITIIGGCKSREGIELTDKHHIITVDNANEELYRQIVFLSYDQNVGLSAYAHRPEGYPFFINSALAMQMEKYKTEQDRKFHVVIDNIDEEIPVELIDEINEENGLSLNVDNWEKVYWGGCLPRYYYLLTAEEIWALADKEVYLCYVGTGVGDIKDANWDTEEGKEVYCQLYGDQVIRYEKGMTLYYEPMYKLGGE
ncbi:MAG: hypothetical protein ACI4EN_02640 [Butyrivibrio sp.]